jgi:hypothetical protein
LAASTRPVFDVKRLPAPVLVVVQLVDDEERPPTTLAFNLPVDGL